MFNKFSLLFVVKNGFLFIIMFALTAGLRNGKMHAQMGMKAVRNRYVASPLAALVPHIQHRRHNLEWQ